jgi:hypothetical protein
VAVSTYETVLLASGRVPESQKGGRMPETIQRRLYAPISLALKPKAQAVHSVVVRFDTAMGLHDEEYPPVADVLVLEATDEQGVVLYRFTTEGVFCGDTWHETIEDAGDQAAYEFGDAVGPWHEIPPDVANTIDYALTRIRPSSG